MKIRVFLCFFCSSMAVYFFLIWFKFDVYSFMPIFCMLWAACEIYFSIIKRRLHVGMGKYAYLDEDELGFWIVWGVYFFVYWGGFFGGGYYIFN